MIDWPEWLHGRVPLVSVSIPTVDRSFTTATVEARLWMSDPVRYSAMMQDHVERKVLKQGGAVLTSDWYLSGGHPFDYPNGLALKKPERGN